MQTQKIKETSRVNLVNYSYYRLKIFYREVNAKVGDNLSGLQKDVCTISIGVMKG